MMDVRGQAYHGIYEKNEEETRSMWRKWMRMLDFVYMRCQGTLLVVTIRLRTYSRLQLLYSIAGGIWGNG